MYAFRQLWQIGRHGRDGYARPMRSTGVSETERTVLKKNKNLEPTAISLGTDIGDIMKYLRTTNICTVFYRASTGGYL
jgi:hypothetical protein